MRILIGVLNWGLGHASRCLPIIHALMNEGHQCIIASDGAALTFLKKNLDAPNLIFQEIVAYPVRYDKKTVWQSFASRVPQLVLAINKEHQQVRTMVKDHSIDLIISDNRLGCYSSACPSIYLTHQLRIFTGNRMLDPFVSRVHRLFINRFSQVWVPDFPHSLLSGELSTVSIRHKQFIGPLSTFKSRWTPRSGKIENVLIVLSGPEPKRSLWEEKLIAQILEWPGGIQLVRGLPESKTSISNLPSRVKTYNFLSREDLRRSMAEADLLVSRCGYSTIMDIVQLRLPSILVPTPGQGEQEYLSTHLQGKIPCIFSQEDDLDLAMSIKELEQRQDQNFPELSHVDQDRRILDLIEELMSL